MRRSKSEVIKSTISSYLKRRRYSDVEQPCFSGIAQPTYTGQQMVLMAAVEKETLQPNSISLGNMGNDAAQVDQQFTRLKNWIAELKLDNCRYELATLLCPMFCHLYLEMLSGSQRQVASKFFKRHQALFASREHSRELLEELASISSSQDIETNPLVKAFRSCKYHLKLSLQATVCLQKYFKEHKHLILLQVVQKWLDIEVICTANEDQEEEDDDVSMILGSSANVNETKPTEVESVQAGMCNGVAEDILESDVDRELEELRGAIKSMRESSSSSLPILLYKIMNHNNDVFCSCCSANISLIAAGIGSNIRLWDLTNCKLNAPRFMSCIPLAAGDTEEPEITGPGRTSVSLYGHRGAVQDIAILSGTEYPSILLSVSQDTKMRSWRLKDFSCAAVYSGHDDPIWCLDSSSLDLYMATGSQDCTARLWTLDRTYPLRTFVGHTLPVESVKFHPNNMYVATGSGDKTIRLWSLNDTSILRLFPGYKSGIRAMAFSPDGKYLASGDDKRIKIWDLAAGAMLKEFKGHTHAVVDLSWSQNNEYVASCSLDGTVRLWNVLIPSKNPLSDSSNDLLRMHTIVGSRPLSIRHSYSNILTCIALS
ncbi:TAF5-like RNA polymerase II p300/CBP-associated factor-associated factor 65 kDa subunit 5L [Anabrus simplex]|uniref:TAF5-like RNA polymerase II p300/CBP-associated factor-associated factor 65 kDa subunit 5L n=1 Tax=Anabrus simplex TaxID=316456 RepID=UPI0035A3B10F